MSNTPALMRRREVADFLAVSQSQILKWEHSGVIVPIRIPGIRAVRYRAADVENLLARIEGGTLENIGGIIHTPREALTK